MRILVDKSVVRYLKSDRKNHGFVSEEIKKDGIEMTFFTHSLEGFARWYVMFGDYAQVLEPQILKERLLEIVDKTRNNLI